MMKTLRKNHVTNNIYDIRSIIIISIILIGFSFLILYLYEYVFVRWSLILVTLIAIIILRKKIFFILKEWKGAKS